MLVGYHVFRGNKLTHLYFIAMCIKTDRGGNQAISLWNSLKSFFRMKDIIKIIYSFISIVINQRMQENIFRSDS